MVVVLEGLKLICQEEKVIIVFRHPPKGELTEEFECWAIHCFAHISEEGDEQGFINASNDGGDNNSGGVDGSQWNPNTTPNTTHNNTEEAQTNEPVAVEITQLLETNASNSSTLDSDNADLVWQMLPGMVDDDNQPLPENIPTPADEGQESAQFFSNLEHSGSCFHCIEGGRKNKACLSFNTDVKPTIQQLFEMFFFKPYVVGVIIPQTNTCLQQGKHHPISYGEFLHWLGLWFLVATINSPGQMDFWSMGEVDYVVGAPMRLGEFMLRKHFEAILKALAFTARQ